MLVDCERCGEAFTVEDHIVYHDFHYSYIFDHTTALVTLECPYCNNQFTKKIPVEELYE